MSIAALTPSQASSVLRLPLKAAASWSTATSGSGTLLLLDQRGWTEYDAASVTRPFPEFTPARLADAFRTKQYAKKALMDQRLVVNVGNIYANEALFAAGIDPSRGRIRSRWTTSRGSIARCSGYSGGDCLTERPSAIIVQGPASRKLPAELMVYEREGEPCRVRDGAGRNPRDRCADHRVLLALPDGTDRPTDRLTDI
jgi:hypothetical protein